MTPKLILTEIFILYYNYYKTTIIIKDIEKVMQTV